MGFVPVDRHPLRSLAHKNIFTIGDAIDVPTSEAGAVAHFEADIFVENFLAAVNGEPFPHRFDGHANCFVELGRGEALLLDFNYDTQLLTGKFPLPGIGPMKLLGASRLNHLGKLAFEKIYWDDLLLERPAARPRPARPHRLEHGRKTPAQGGATDARELH